MLQRIELQTINSRDTLYRRPWPHTSSDSSRGGAATMTWAGHSAGGATTTFLRAPTRKSQPCTNCPATQLLCQLNVGLLLKSAAEWLLIGHLTILSIDAVVHGHSQRCSQPRSRTQTRTQDLSWAAILNSFTLLTISCSHKISWRYLKRFNS